MAETLSLKELKAQNESKADTTETQKPAQAKESLTDDYVEEVEEVETVEDEDDGSEDAPESESDTDSWMQTESPENSDDDQSGFIPNHKAAQRRRKAKALKATVKEQEDELTRVRTENEALRNGTYQQPQQQQIPDVPPRPTREQHGYDDDAYDAALDKWSDLKTRILIAKQQQDYQGQQVTQQRQQQVADNRNKSLDDHYMRAEKLVSEGKVTADKFKTADLTVRQALNNTGIANGDALADQLIDTLNGIGDQSEKVMYQLGVNPAKLNQLTDLMVSDPSGLKAATYLGMLHTQISNPNKRRSTAPSPARSVDGESVSTQSPDKMRRKYSKMSDTQERFSYKRQAKREGVDVSNW